MSKRSCKGKVRKWKIGKQGEHARLLHGGLTSWTFRGKRASGAVGLPVGLQKDECQCETANDAKNVLKMAGDLEFVSRTTSIRKDGSEFYREKLLG